MLSGALDLAADADVKKAEALPKTAEHRFCLPGCRRRGWWYYCMYYERQWFRIHRKRQDPDIDGVIPPTIQQNATVSGVRRQDQRSDY